MLNHFRGRFRNEAASIFKKENYYEIIIFSAFFSIQLFLRFSFPGFHGAWLDEVATSFFSTHLGTVFTEDSHSIFYYLFVAPISLFDPLNFIQLRLFHSLISLCLGVIILFRSRHVFTKGQWLFFNVVYGLHPLVFGMSRLARQYGILIDLAVLLIIECRLFESKRNIFLISLFQTLLFPLSVIPLSVEWFFNVNRRVLFKIFIFSSMPCLIYYILKFLFDSGPVDYVSWIDSRYDIFFFNLINMFAGRFYPFYQSDSFFIGNFIFLVLLTAMVSSAFYFNLKEGKKALLVFFVCFGSVYLGANLLSYFLDLRIERYYIFLFPYFLFAFTYCIPPERFLYRSCAILVGFLIVLEVVYIRPYFKKLDTFGDYVDLVKFQSKVRGIPVLGCGRRAQLWFFKENGFSICSDPEDIRKFKHNSGPFIYAFTGDNLQGMDHFQDRVVLDSLFTRNGRLLFIAGKNESAKK